MNLEKQSGFTIVELTLFVAISGLLFLVVFIGTGNTLRATRFTDSVRSTQSHLQKQADEILNGVNSRDLDLSCDSSGVGDTGQQPGTSSCLLIGRTLHFHDNVIDSYYVVGTAIPTINGGSPVSDTDLILLARPTLVKQSRETYIIPWQLQVTGGLVTGTSVEANTVTILRSPQSSQLYTYSADISESSLANTTDMLLTSSLNLSASPPVSFLNTPTTYCLNSPGDGTATASLTMASNKSSNGASNGNQKAENAVTTEFDITTRTNVCVAGGP